VWSGTISFGLVSVPVAMFTATAEHQPSFNVRRAAFHVEDHPLDYIDFEGSSRPDSTARPWTT
jgi:hypothetical protein